MPQFTPISSGGGGASFAFDGVTFTIGSYNTGSGQRTVDVELTLNGNAITSGQVSVMFCVLDRTDLDPSTDPSYISFYWGPDIGVGIGTSSNGHLFWLVPASSGHMKATWTFGQDTTEDKTFYIAIVMPSGAIEFSDLITLPALVV